MSVIAGVLLFIAGVMTGGGAVYYNQYSIRQATASLRRENEKLKDSAVEDAMKYTGDRAYRKGFQDGRRNPMTGAEQFAETFEGMRAQFGGQRKRQEG